MHVLPKGFTKIRHDGILSSSWKKKKLPALQQSMPDYTPEVAVEKNQEQPQTVLRKCPACKTGILLTLIVFDKRGPPKRYKKLMQKLETKL